MRGKKKKGAIRGYSKGRGCHPGRSWEKHNPLAEIPKKLRRAKTGDKIMGGGDISGMPYSIDLSYQEKSKK